MQKWQCRVAPSLGSFDGEPNDVWGTVPYTNDTDPTVFFGLYGLPDFYTLWRHKGKKAVLWAGSDIRHFMAGYWLDTKGDIRIHRGPFAEWLMKNVDNYVENIAEYEELAKVGIDAQIVPSFLGNVNDYAVTYQKAKRPKVYASVSGNDFDLYKWNEIEQLASENPGIDFYLYGNSVEWHTECDNVIVRGRVAPKVMNDEIKYMQGGLRPLDFDGFSEVIAKSFLWGQYPISTIPYEHALSLNELYKLHELEAPNIAGRNYYIDIINNYPWNVKNN